MAPVQGPDSKSELRRRLRVSWVNRHVGFLATAFGLFLMSCSDAGSSSRVIGDGHSPLEIACGQSAVFESLELKFSVRRFDRATWPHPTTWMDDPQPCWCLAIRLENT